MLKLKLQILRPPGAKSWFNGKDPDAGKDWRWEETGTTENEMVGWHHWLDGHEFEQAPGDGERQGSLACCSPWGRRVRHDWATQQQHLDGKPPLRSTLLPSSPLLFCSGPYGLTLIGHVCVCCVLTHFSRVWLFAAHWNAAHQALLSMWILQAGILEWVATHFSRGSSQPRDQTLFSYFSCFGSRVLYH